MPYRGFPYFVTQSAGSDHRIDPYASERHRMPDRPRGVRYVSTPPSGQRIKPYEKPNSTYLDELTAIEPKITRSAVDVVEPMKLLISLLLIIFIVLGMASVGIYAAREIVGFMDGPTSPMTSSNAYGSEREDTGTPQTGWKRGSVPILYQTDPQWAALPYEDGTVGTSGAAPLCLAMTRISLTGDASVGPGEIAVAAQQAGYLDAGDSDALLSDGAVSFGLTVRTVNPDELAIRRELVAGRPIIVSVSSDAFGSEPTCIVLTGIDERSFLEIRDPQSRARTAEHWSFSDIIDASTTLYSYSVAR